MNRRTWLGLAALGAGVLLMGHSPYRQWQAYRRSRLLIATSAGEPASFALGSAVARLLATHVPPSRAMASRARDTVAIVKLIASQQFDVGLLTEADAREAFVGAGRFVDEGPVPLRVLASLGSYLFVCRDDFPAANAYQIAKALSEQWSDLPPALVAPAARPDPDPALTVPVHAAALDYYQGRPLPAASDP